MRSWLARPGLPWLGLGLALLLLAPTLGFGLRMDDRWHRIFVRGGPPYPGLTEAPHRLFDFFDGGERLEFFRSIGFVAWFADPGCSISFFRPLSSLLHHAEHRYLGEHVWAMHATSLALYAALVAAAVALYRRLFARASWGAETAGLASWMFALDHTHGTAAGWIAQRNSLLAALFSLLALLAHDRARRDDDRRAALLAPAFVLLALLSAEAGTAALAAIFAHAMTLEKPGQRLRALVPSALAAAPWLVAYVAGGHGVRNSGMYLNAMRDPLGALPRMFVHLATLLGTELGNPLTDFWPLATPEGRVAAVALSSFLLAGASVAAAPLLARDPAARFLALASLLVLLPPSATAPSSRLLLFASVFQLGLLARTATSLLRDPPPALRLQRWLGAGVIGYATLGHVLLSPLLLPGTSSQMVTFERALGRLAKGMPEAPAGGTRAIIANAPDMSFIGYTMLLGAPMGKTPPDRLLALANGTRDVTLTGIDEHTIAVENQGGFVHSITDTLTRSPASPLPLGSSFDVGGILIEITRLDDKGRADAIRVRFPAPLTHPSFAFLRWQPEGLAPMLPPAPGETIHIAGRPFLDAMFEAMQNQGRDVPGL